jgi:hypothetical protein
MTTWVVCTMDDGVLHRYDRKRDAVNAVWRMAGYVEARRLRAGEYEYSTTGDGRGIVNTYYVMTVEGARRNGWEINP